MWRPKQNNMFWCKLNKMSLHNPKAFQRFALSFCGFLLFVRFQGRVFVCVSRFLSESRGRSFLRNLKNSHELGNYPFHSALIRNLFSKGHAMRMNFITPQHEGNKLPAIKVTFLLNWSYVCGSMVMIPARVSWAPSHWWTTAFLYAGACHCVCTSNGGIVQW